MHNDKTVTHISSFSVGKMLIAVLFFLTKIAIEFKVISALWIPKLPAAILHNIDLTYYSFFFTLFIFVYRNKLMLWCQDLKSNFNRHKKIIIYGLIITVACVVIVSIVLSKCCGINDSANEEWLTKTALERPIYVFITTVLVGPAVEECIFRDIIITVIKRKSTFFYTALAVICTSLIFAFSHLSYNSISAKELLALIPYFILGFGLAISYVRSDNLLCPIIIHMLINLIARH